MLTKVYYIENSEALEKALNLIQETIPCFINSEFIEMNYSSVLIKARQEDFPFIEKTLAPLV